MLLGVRMALKLGARRLKADAAGRVGALDGARVPRREKRGHARRQPPAVAQVRLPLGTLQQREERLRGSGSLFDSGY